MRLWYCNECKVITNATVCPICGQATEGATIEGYNTSHTFIADMKELTKDDNWEPMKYKGQYTTNSI